MATLVVPAHSRVELAPGGKHLMMRSPRENLEVGDKVPVTLGFASGQSKVLAFIVTRDGLASGRGRTARNALN